MPLRMSQGVHRRRWHAIRDLVGEVADGLITLAPRVEAHAARTAYPAVAGGVISSPIPWHPSCFPPAPVLGMVQRDLGIVGELADRLPAVPPAPVSARYIREVLLVVTPLVLVMPVAPRRVCLTLLCCVGIHHLRCSHSVPRSRRWVGIPARAAGRRAAGAACGPHAGCPCMAAAR